MWIKYSISFFVPLSCAVNCSSNTCRTPLWKEETLPHLEEEEHSFPCYGNTNSIGFGRNSDLPPVSNFPHLMKQSLIFQSQRDGNFTVSLGMENYYISGERFFLQTRQLNQRQTNDFLLKDLARKGI